MEYNLAGLRQRVLVDKLDDEEFDPNIVDNFINDTLRDIFNQFELPFQEKIFQGVVPAGSTMFQLPTDVALVQSQTFSGVSRFADKKINWRDFFTYYPDAANETPGKPVAWTTYGGNILLNAPTDEEYTMTIFYISKPTKLTLDSSVPEVPEEFSELLVLGAFKRILERNEDYDLATAVAGEYERQLLNLVNRYGFRMADGGITMKKG